MAIDLGASRARSKERQGHEPKACAACLGVNGASCPLDSADDDIDALLEEVERLRGELHEAGVIAERIERGLETVSSTSRIEFDIEDIASHSAANDGKLFIVNGKAYRLLDVTAQVNVHTHAGQIAIILREAGGNEAGWPKFARKRPAAPR